MNLNELRDKAYKIACEHGFHNQELSNEHFLCLVISKLLKAVEADRKGRLERECKLRFEMDYNRYPVLVEEEKRFRCSFEKNVKDTLPDELADAYISLLDLSGLRGITIDDFSEEAKYESTESCNGESFTESIYAIIILPVRLEHEYDYSFDRQLNCMLLSILGLANHLNIDLSWHVEQKMKYNQYREKMHGKKY